MKIALVSARADPYIPPVNVHGGTVVMLNLINSLSRLGHQVDIYTRLDKDLPSESKDRRFRARRQQEEGGAKQVIDKNTTMYRYPYDSSGEETNIWEKQFNESYTFLKEIQDPLERGQYDVIHYFHLASVSGWYKEYDRPPMIEKSTFSPLFLAAGRKFEKIAPEKLEIEKRILTDMPIVSGQSEGEVEKIIKHHGISNKKISMVPLGVDLSIFYSKDDFDYLLKTKEVILTCPNNIKPQKKQLEVLKVLKYLKDMNHRVLVSFIGNINDEEYLETMLSHIDENALTHTTYEGKFTRDGLISLSKDVIFIPSQREKVLANIIRSSDVAVFPSTDEGFSLVNLNCMACGVVPVCSDNKEYTYYMRPNENALSIPANEGWQSYANAVESLICDRDLLKALSENSAKSAKHFTWDTFVTNQIKVYESL